MSEKLEGARRRLCEGQLAEASSTCDELLRALPNHYQSVCLAGEISQKKGDIQEALATFARAIRLQPDESFAYYKRANLLKDSGRFEESLDDYERAITRNSNFAHAFCNRGAVLQHIGRFQEALDSYDRAIEIDSTDAFALFNRGDVLRQMNMSAEALESYRLAIEANPRYVECYCNLGLLQTETGNFRGALASYDSCIEIDPGFFTAHFNRGVLLQAQKKWDGALASYSQVIDLKSDHAEAYCNRGVVLMELRKWAGASADFDRAIQLKPNFEEAYLNRGNLFAHLWRHQEALDNYDKAIALKSDCAEAFHNRADLLLQAGRFAAAIESYDSALSIDPGRRYLRGMRLYAQMNLCDWTNFDADLESLINAIEGDGASSPPFPLLALVDRPELHLRCAKSWAEIQCSIAAPPDVISSCERSAKIRIGYFSGDFHIHPVPMLMAGVIESHDRSRFEVIAFSYGPGVHDQMRRRLEKAFDRFLDVRDVSDQDIASMSRSLEIDVAIDLAGYTGNGRTKIFAWRAAPIQVSYLGYLGTMATPFMDYLLADATIVPSFEQQYYSEKIIYLPSYQANDSKKRISDTVYTREQLGLPQGVFVFACFNANYKITPAIFSTWMRILDRVRDSVLYLYAGNSMVEENIRRAAERCGIDSCRIIFGAKLELEEYLARYRVMDLFLDTLPYNAGTTASDALWAGLPVLTCAGRTFAGRVAASLLTAINLPELITSTMAEYEKLAVKLATTPEMMAKVREKLAVNRLVAPLFNTLQFTQSLEAGYIEAIRSYQEGLEPQHIYVSDAAAVPNKRDPK